MVIKSVFIKITAWIITAVMLMFAGTVGTEQYDVKSPGSCLLNYPVLSDSHIEANNTARYNVFVNSLRNAGANKSGNDAVVFLGDNTMNGQITENLLFHGAVAEILGSENVLTVVGNHDIGNGEWDYETLQRRWYEYTRTFFGRELEHPYYCEIIDGYYFIVLGMESQEVYDMYISEEQFDWLEGVLGKAAQSGKPAFVFSHYPADDVVDENGNPSSRLTEMLAAYNEEHDIFSFVGHTHMSTYLFWSFHSYDGYPEIYLPRLTELAGPDDNEIFKESGVGAEVEVYENEVIVRCRNFYTGEWRTEDGTPTEMTYALKNPVGG